MTNLSKIGKQISAFAIVFAIVAVSLFTGSVFVNAAEPLCTSGGAILYWDGTEDNALADNGETGTPDNPIIIDSASELNYLANKVGGGTEAGKLCYKMADGISEIYLQPESIATADADGNGFFDITELTDGASTKAFFDSITPVNWSLADNETWFAGTFDGNGVEFIGMYSRSGSAGLFPTADGGAILKNFAVTNSYINGAMTRYNAETGVYSGQCRTGAVVGGTCGEKYGAKVIGTVTFDSIIVANNYIFTDMGFDQGAVIMGTNNSEDFANINNVVVYGNLTGCLKTPDSPLGLFNGYGGGAETNKLTNSVILGVTPYPASGRSDKNTGVDTFENVYTDADFSNVVIKAGQDPVVYTETDFISVAGLSPKQLVEKCGSLLGAYHGTVSLHQDPLTHAVGCDICGFALLDGVVNHTWDEQTYKCTACDFECTHQDKTVDPNFAGDCVTPKGVRSQCNICGKIESTPAAGATAPGHDLKWVPEKAANCQSTGRLGYWHCKTCNSNFAGEEDKIDDVKFAPMSKSIADPENYEGFIIAVAQHKSTQIKIDGSKGHYWLCDTCGGRLLSTESKKTVEEGRVKRHTWKDGVCADCTLKCPNHNYKPSGNVISAGSCTEDRVEELACTICGDTKTTSSKNSHEIVKVEEVAATDKLEGKKAHYTCNKCKALFADAEGKVPTDVLSLVIPKILPPEYQNPDSIGSIGNSSSNNDSTSSGTTSGDSAAGNSSANGSTSSDSAENTDTSKTSPKTNDNIASVIAVAMLAGAGFVIANKARKA